jgi:hypothetical protein
METTLDLNKLELVLMNQDELNQTDVGNIISTAFGFFTDFLDGVAAGAKEGFSNY